jgi:hypothetical protein
MRLRFSLIGLMSAVFLLGIGFAALHQPSRLWASALFTLSLTSILLAVLAARYTRRAERAFWSGFAFCGGMYLLVHFGPWLQVEVGPYSLATVFIDLLYPPLHPPPPAPPPQVGAKGVMSGKGRFSSSYVPPTAWALWTTPDERRSFTMTRVGQITLSSPEPFRRIGHSIISLLVAALGGLTARYLFSTRIE